MTLRRARRRLVYLGRLVLQLIRGSEICDPAGWWACSLYWSRVPRPPGHSGGSRGRDFVLIVVCVFCWLFFCLFMYRRCVPPLKCIVGGLQYRSFSSVGESARRCFLFICTDSQLYLLVLFLVAFLDVVFFFFLSFVFFVVFFVYALSWLCFYLRKLRSVCSELGVSSARYSDLRFLWPSYVCSYRCGRSPVVASRGR